MKTLVEKVKIPNIYYLATQPPLKYQEIKNSVCLKMLQV